MYIFWKKNCGSRKEIQIPVQIGDSRTVSKRGDPGFVLSPSGTCNFVFTETFDKLTQHTYCFSRLLLNSRDYLLK